MPRLVAYPTRTLPAGPKAGSLYATHSAIPMTRNTMASLLSQFLPSFSSMSNAFFHGTLAAGGAGGKAAAARVLVRAGRGLEPSLEVCALRRERRALQPTAPMALVQPAWVGEREA